MRTYGTAVALLHLFVALACVRADEIHLKDGRILEGTVLERKDGTLVVQVKVGKSGKATATLTVKEEDVLRIVPQAEIDRERQVAEEAKKQQDADARARLEALLAAGDLKSLLEARRDAVSLGDEASRDAIDSRLGIRLVEALFAPERVPGEEDLRGLIQAALETEKLAIAHGLARRWAEAGCPVPVAGDAETAPVDRVLLDAAFDSLCAREPRKLEEIAGWAKEHGLAGEAAACQEITTLEAGPAGKWPWLPRLARAAKNLGDPFLEKLLAIAASEDSPRVRVEVKPENSGMDGVQALREVVPAGLGIEFCDASSKTSHEIEITLEQEDPLRMYNKVTGESSTSYVYRSYMQIDGADWPYDIRTTHHVEEPSELVGEWKTYFEQLTHLRSIVLAFHLQGDVQAAGQWKGRAYLSSFTSYEEWQDRRMAVGEVHEIATGADGKPALRRIHQGQQNLDNLRGTEQGLYVLARKGYSDSYPMLHLLDTRTGDLGPRVGPDDARGWTPHGRNLLRVVSGSIEELDPAKPESRKVHAFGSDVPELDRGREGLYEPELHSWHRLVIVPGKKSIVFLELEPAPRVVSRLSPRVPPGLSIDHIAGGGLHVLGTTDWGGYLYVLWSLDGGPQAQAFRRGADGRFEIFAVATAPQPSSEWHGVLEDGKLLSTFNSRLILTDPYLVEDGAMRQRAILLPCGIEPPNIRRPLFVSSVSRSVVCGAGRRLLMLPEFEFSLSGLPPWR